MSNNNTQSGGVGISGVLFIVFLVLKLVGVIAWSWWWVTAPLWIPVLAVIAVLFIVALLAGIAKLMD